MKLALFNFLICMVITIIIAPFIIKFLYKLKFGQSILIYVEKHKQKGGTATMGGIIFLISSIAGYFIFFAKNNVLGTTIILSFLFFGILGFLDDFIKIKFKQNEGLKPYQKIIGQLGISIILAIFIYNSELVGSICNIPFSSKTIDFGYWIIPFVIFIYLAIVNSVNLIDGLDGLCGGVSSVVLIVMSIVVFLASVGIDNDILVAEYQNIVIVCMGIAGSLLGFLCFNSYPAKVFMGDTGSLALGGAIASVTILSRNYFLIIIVGFMFVLTTMSVILQVASFKLTHKRIFKMSPIHHHFEQSTHETKVVAIYIIVTIAIGILTIGLYL